MKPQSLVTIDGAIHATPRPVTVSGTSLTLSDILGVARGGVPVSFTKDRRILRNVETCYERMMEQVRDGVPIYGCNTGYGARASVVVNSGTEKDRMSQARAISESIVHTDVTVGPELTSDVTRAAMLIRINMLMRGVSAVRISDLDIYRRMLNEGITPVVHAYGGLGASGDLAHNARVLSAARQLPETYVTDADGTRREARAALKSHNIPKLVLEPKAGLGLVNGDNFSTAAAALIASDLISYMLIEDVLGAIVIEALKGSNRAFHQFLTDIRPHEGQREVAALYRGLLEGSRLAYQEMRGHVRRPPGVKVQDAYSLRCISQAEGINREQMRWIIEKLEMNANSVSDNPLWVAPEFATDGEAPWQWVSGGNFLAQYAGESIDMMRKIITRYVKRNDRHLHRLVSPHESNGLPPNLSDGGAISACAFKGMQLQSGMFDVYSMTLAQPVTTLFGIHEESNQDITVHSLTSAIMAWQNLEVMRYSMAMTLIAVAQAVDLRGGGKLLAPRTRPVYEFIREKSTYVSRERPLASDIRAVARSIETGELAKLVRKSVTKGMS